MNEDQKGFSYKVICDKTNNTPEDVENGVVNADIIITYHKPIDELPLPPIFSHSTGAPDAL